MNTFHDFGLFINRAQRLSIRNAVQRDLESWKKYAKENKEKLNMDEVETIYQIEDFLEIFDILVQPK